jgi:hypothetical protein
VGDHGVKQDTLGAAMTSGMTSALTPALSPRERAGVRASVNAHTIQNVEEAVTRVKSAGWAGCKKRVATTGCLRKSGPKRKSAFFSNVFAKLTECNNFLLHNNDANLNQ